MDIKDYARQYANRELCEEWRNNIPCTALQDEKYTLYTYSQDIRAICDEFSFLEEDDITGVILAMGDGDYTEVYVTESSRPYEYWAIYHPLEYYL